MDSTKTLGVVIGRFQVPELHDGHRHIINYARGRNEQLLIILGSGRGFPTARNPLSFNVRRAMLSAEFVEATVLQHYDNPSDEAWSASLDRLIGTVFGDYAVTLYGSRDSFIPHYSGKYRVEMVPEIASQSGTSLRNEISSGIQNSSDFRRGIIHTHATRNPIPYPAVDVAVIHKERREVLLGEKTTDGGKRRFIGGFFDPAVDISYERAAKREVIEETSGIEIDDLVYLGSSCIDDWRYTRDDDRIVTTFFKATYIFGAPRHADDLDALHWTPYEKVLESLVPQHRHLGELLMKSLTS